MICLNDNSHSGRLNQILDFFDYLYKSCNFKLCQIINFFSNSKKPKKEENRLNGAAAQLMFVAQDFVNSNMQYHYFKAKFFKGIQVYPQHLVRVMVDKSGKKAQGVLNILK